MPVVAPRRDVTRIIEVVGPKGGIILVHLMACGHYMTRRTRAKSTNCIACAVESVLNPTD